MFAFDRQRFFADWSARSGTALTPPRQQGLAFLLDEFERDAGFTQLRELAYVLATIHWETARTFQPIREYRANRATNPRHYDIQQRYWPSGYFGRGYVQLTWDYNYRKAGQRLAGERYTVNGATIVVTERTFLDQPDHLLDPAISYRIAARGMREGWFTGKRLSQYITGAAPPDYVNARRIINGTDRAADIATIANAYEFVLRAAHIGGAAPVAAGGGAASVGGRGAAGPDGRAAGANIGGRPLPIPPPPSPPPMHEGATVASRTTSAPSATKAPGRKGAAKKVAAKKTAAKKTITRTGATRAIATKSAAKKSTARKLAAKKSGVKKAVAKKAVAKKAVAKKTAAKKTVAKKTVAKRKTSRKK